MTYKKPIYNRHSIRLRGYDYSQQGLYFITMCTQNRAYLFGNIVGANNHSPNNQFPNNHLSQIKQSVMILNDAGKIANECWMAIPKHYPHVILHEYIIMPNHIHGIIEIKPVGANNHSPNNQFPNNQPPNNDNVTIDCIAIGNGDFLPNNYCNANAWHENEMNKWYGNRANAWHENGNRANEWHENGNRANECGGDRANNYSPLRGTSKTIGSVVRGFKIGVTKWMRQNTNVYDVWQRNYHEHIIRNEQSYFRITEYILQNPNMWGNDRFFIRNHTIR